MLCSLCAAHPGLCPLSSPVSPHHTLQPWMPPPSPHPPTNADLSRSLCTCCMGVAPLHVPPRPFCSRTGRPQNPLPGPCRLGKRSLCKTAPGRWPLAHHQAPQPPDTTQGTMPGGWTWGHGPWGWGVRGQTRPRARFTAHVLGSYTPWRFPRATGCSVQGRSAISRGAPPRLPLLATRHFHVYGRCGRRLGSGYLAKGPFYAVPCFLSQHGSRTLPLSSGKEPMPRAAAFWHLCPQ
jgi:hypothetical protein